ncbi:MAG: beta-ketoacyl-ACP synthase III [Candidatus Omnitrophota bacterium]
MSVKVGIIGVGMAVPRKIVTNADLEKMVDTSDEWITTRTGIRQRRIVEKGQVTSDLAAEAAKKALKEAKLKAHDIELLIIGTITPDRQMPSTACIVQEKLGAKKAICFDISAACAGFIFALSIAKAFIESGAYKNALVVGAEVLSSVVDWKDRSTCVLFGDGAGAAVVAPVRRGGILSTYLSCDGTKAAFLEIPAGGCKLPASTFTIEGKLHCIKMRGSEVFKIAVRAMIEACEKALSLSKLKTGDVDFLIPHQANLRIIDAMVKRLGIPKEKVVINLDRYGNMSSATTPVALCESIKAGKIKKGDIILMVAFGAGLVWGACVIRW